MFCLLTAALLAVFGEQTCASLRVQRNENLLDRLGVAGVVEGMCLRGNRIFKIGLIKIREKKLSFK